MALDRTPPYLQVVQELRQRIVSGELRDGDRLPSVREIAEQYSIAQATALRVLATLRADGLAESVVGVGTIVSTRRSLHRSARDRFTSALRTGKIYPENEYAKILKAELSPAPAWVAGLLGIEEGEAAIRRDRITYNEDGPISASTSWFSAEYAESVPELLQKERIIGGTARAILAATGRTASPQENSSEASTVAGATAEQAQSLEIDEGAHVHLGRNIFYDSDGEIVEIGESAAPEGRWKIHS